MKAIGFEISEGLEDFLAFLRDAEEMNRIAQVEEQENNNKQQDLLHEIELSEHGYHDFAKLAKKMQEVRKSRRVAKDNQEVVSPLIEWVEMNRGVIKNLERVLGDVRKKERRLENRVYIPRAKE